MYHRFIGTVVSPFAYYTSQDPLLYLLFFIMLKSSLEAMLYVGLPAVGTMYIERNIVVYFSTAYYALLRKYNRTIIYNTKLE